MTPAIGHRVVAYAETGVQIRRNLGTAVKFRRSPLTRIHLTPLPPP
jgi:hypothetical protein